MDQRSGDRWISGWSEIFVRCKRNSNAKFWSTRCEDRFSTEQNHPEYPLQEKRSVWRKWKLTKKTVSFEENRLLTWSTITSGSLGPMILSRIIQSFLQLFFKWLFSEVRYKMRWNSIINDENPIWWHLGTIVQIENTRVWKTQDRIGIVQPGDSSEESRTWLSQIENNGEKMYRARHLFYHLAVLAVRHLHLP